MARATRYGGPSLTAAETADPVSPQPVRVRRAELGYVDRPNKAEEVSSSLTDGGDSTQSSKNSSTSDSKQSGILPSPAHTTESHSNQQETESDYTADSTATVGRRKPQPQSSKRARSRSTVEDEDEFGEFE